MADAFTKTEKKARAFAQEKERDFDAEIESLRSDLGSVIDMVSKFGRDRGALGAKAGDLLDEALKAGRKAKLSAGKEARGVEARLLSEIEEHPWRAVGIAALGGMAIGWFLGRK